MSLLNKTIAFIGAGNMAEALIRGLFANKAMLASRMIATDVRPERLEELLDAVTALSGSGPAYIFYVTEAMIQAGIAQGLSPADARKLAVHTVFGAGILLAQTGEEPAELRRKVTSPGGTTEAALKVMQ